MVKQGSRDEILELWFTCLFSSDMPCISQTRWWLTPALADNAQDAMLTPHLQGMTQLEPRRGEGGNMTKQRIMRTGPGSQA